MSRPKSNNSRENHNILTTINAIWIGKRVVSKQSLSQFSAILEVNMSLQQNVLSSSKKAPSLRHLHVKATTNLHHTYSKNGGNPGLVKNIILI